MTKEGAAGGLDKWWWEMVRSWVNFEGKANGICWTIHCMRERVQSKVWGLINRSDGAVIHWDGNTGRGVVWGWDGGGGSQKGLGQVRLARLSTMQVDMSGGQLGIWVCSAGGGLGRRYKLKAMRPEEMTLEVHVRKEKVWVLSPSTHKRWRSEDVEALANIPGRSDNQGGEETEWEQQTRMWYLETKWTEWEAGSHRL